MAPRLALAAVVLLVGCGADSRPVQQDTPARAAASPPHVVLRFRASDGRRLRGRLTPATQRHAPAVVLVHGLYGEPAQWDEFAGHLHRAGFTTLAYASRSDHQPDEGVLARDLAGAVRALRARPEADPDRIVLAGASVGGSTVAYALGTRRRLGARGGVAFSALEGPREVALGKHHGFRPHGLLLISDRREADNARALRADAHGQGTTIFLTEATGHGTALVADPGARDRALAWLERLTA